jgi:hypothetical protein
MHVIASVPPITFTGGVFVFGAMITLHLGTNTVTLRNSSLSGLLIIARALRVKEAGAGSAAKEPLLDTYQFPRACFAKARSTRERGGD